MSQAKPSRAWCERWAETYFVKGRPIDQQLKDYDRVEQLPSATKLGLCIYIQCIPVMGFVLKELFRDMSLGRNLPQPTRVRVTKELASYVLFEVVKQVWEYGTGGKQREDALEILDTVSYWFAQSYHISVQSKLQEYQQAENPLEHAGRRIADSKDLVEIMRASITVTSGSLYLFEGIEHMYSLSERKMTDVIQDFFSNYWEDLMQPNSG